MTNIKHNLIYFLLFISITSFRLLENTNQIENEEKMIEIVKMPDEKNKSKKPKQSDSEKEKSKKKSDPKNFKIASFGFAEAQKPKRIPKNSSAASNHAALQGKGSITGRTISNVDGKGSKTRSIVFISSHK